MGGGVSSLSKVCVIGPSTRPDADIDYTFAQVQVKEAKVDYSANCGNMSSAMGPFAVDEGLVKVSGQEALVRVHNTNTKKIIWSRFPLDDGAGGGRRRSRDSRRRGHRRAGQARVPRAGRRDHRQAAADRQRRRRRSTCRAAARSASRWWTRPTPACSSRAADLGITGTELPDEIDAQSGAAEEARGDPRRRLGRDGHRRRRRRKPRRRSRVPFVGFVSAPQEAQDADGRSDRRVERSI